MQKKMMLFWMSVIFLYISNIFGIEPITNLSDYNYKWSPTIGDLNFKLGKSMIDAEISSQPDEVIENWVKITDGPDRERYLKVKNYTLDSISSVTGKLHVSCDFVYKVRTARLNIRLIHVWGKVHSQITPSISNNKLTFSSGTTTLGEYDKEVNSAVVFSAAGWFPVGGGPFITAAILEILIATLGDNLIESLAESQLTDLGHSDLQISEVNDFLTSMNSLLGSNQLSLNTTSCVNTGKDAGLWLNCTYDGTNAVTNATILNILNIGFNSKVTLVPPTNSTLISKKTYTFSYTNAGDPITMVNWEFGDNTSSDVLNNVDHAYNESGIYTLILTAEGLTQKSTKVLNLKVVNSVVPYLTEFLMLE